LNSQSFVEKCASPPQKMLIIEDEERKTALNLLFL
jgi:hypothetical protein